MGDPCCFDTVQTTRAVGVSAVAAQF